MSNTTPIRVIHQLEEVESPASLVEHCTGLHAAFPGIDAEAFVSIDGSRAVILERWPDEKTYAEHWSQAARELGSHAVLGGRAPRPSEFYRYEPFRLDRVWFASSLPEPRRSIVWPSQGAVRVLVQLALADSSTLHEQLIADESTTRPEPGCEQYEWLRGVESTNHFLLVELWQSQFLYDNHWHLRLATEPAPPLPRVDRDRGANGIEFYRHQPFRHLHDRWLPLDPSRWSETVVWPSGEETRWLFSRRIGCTRSASWFAASSRRPRATPRSSGSTSGVSQSSAPTS